MSVQRYRFPVVLTRTEHASIEESQAVEVALAVIRNACDLPTNAYLEGGRIKFDEEIRAGGHSHFETRDVREATGDDWAVMVVVENLQRWLARKEPPTPFA